MRRSDTWVAPTSISMNVHSIDSLRARSNGGVEGSFHIEAMWDGYETAAIVFFTGDSELAQKLAQAINETVEAHQRIAAAEGK